MLGNSNLLPVWNVELDLTATLSQACGGKDA
jgi:hypothetical protein